MGLSAEAIIAAYQGIQNRQAEAPQNIPVIIADNLEASHQTPPQDIEQTSQTNLQG